MLDTINNYIASISYPEKPAGLYQPVKYTMDGGGKRLRPLLCLSTVNALGGNISEALDVAIGIEMFHNFTLLHDDIMDNADVRRGRPTVHKKWDENTAILSGDAMLTMATQLVSNVPDKYIRPILNLFNTTAMQIYEGQQLDVDFEERKDVTVDEYIEMIRLKTSVLLGCACKSGAIVSGATDQVAEAFYQFGMLLGIAFQLQDDMLDTYGDPMVFGKQTGGDILYNKKTWLLITAIAEDSTGKILRAVQGRYDGQEKIDTVVQIYNSLDLENRIIKLVEKYTNLALQQLDQTGLSEEKKQPFVQLAANLKNRTN